MREVQYILALFLLEIIIFTTEIVFSCLNTKNRKLKKASNSDELDFIDLSEGYRTSISFFRVSIFISYLILVFIYLDISKENSVEKYLMIFVVGILVYMVSLFNVKTFIFYTDYFIVTAPFNFFKRDTLINYNAIGNFKLYRALYNSYFLKLNLKTNRTSTIQFSGSFNPRNDLVIKIIINSKIDIREKKENYGSKHVKENNSSRP